MTNFDQRGLQNYGSLQNVGTQFNVTGDVGQINNFDSVHNKQDVTTQLQKLPALVNNAIDAGILNDDIGIEVEYRVKKIVQESGKDKPNKKKIVDYLNQAKELITGVTAAAGLLTVLDQAVKAVLAFF